MCGRVRLAPSKAHADPAQQNTSANVFLAQQVTVARVIHYGSLKNRVCTVELICNSKAVSSSKTRPVQRAVHVGRDGCNVHSDSIDGSVRTNQLHRRVNSWAEHALCPRPCRQLSLNAEPGEVVRASIRAVALHLYASHLP